VFEQRQVPQQGPPHCASTLLNRLAQFAVVFEAITQDDRGIDRQIAQPFARPVEQPASTSAARWLRSGKVISSQRGALLAMQFSLLTIGLLIAVKETEAAEFVPSLLLASGHNPPADHRRGAVAGAARSL
jgi:hypothetical protein